MEQKIRASIYSSKKATDVLGFNPSEMTWMDLEMDLLLRVDTSHGETETPPGRSTTLIDAGFAIRSITQAFASTMNRNAEAILEAAQLGSQGYGKVLPWFPSIDRRITALDAPGFDFPIPGFDVERPLAGQRVDNLDLVVGLVRLDPNLIYVTEFEARHPEIMMPNDSRLGTPIVVIGITSLGFDEGGLYHWLKVRASVLALAISLMGPPLPVTKGIDIGVAKYALNTEIGNALQAHAPAVEFGGFRFSGTELDNLGIRAFDFEEPGITKAERQHRIANCQLAFRIMFHTNIVIDGEDGPEVRAHLKRVADLNHLPASIRDPFIRAELLKALRPPFKW